MVEWGDGPVCSLAFARLIMHCAGGNKKAPSHRQGFLCGARRSGCNDAYDVPSGWALDAEGHFSSDLGKQGVVFAHPDVEPGMDSRATLANDNFAGVDGLTAVALYAETFGLGIATVTGTAACLFMCHEFLSLGRSRAD